MAEHVVDELHDFAAGHLSPEEVRRVEAHLSGCAQCRVELEAVEVVQAGLVAPAPEVFRRLSGALVGAGRFEHLLPKLAELFDIEVSEARALLERAEDPAVWQTEMGPGVKVAPVAAGPKNEGAFNVLVKLEPGAEFPHHEHGGRERVLVLEGGYRDVSGTEFWRGELDVRAEGTSHSFTGLPGQGCLCAAVMFPVAGGA
jgi:putative transcriptional regulator